MELNIKRIMDLLGADIEVENKSDGSIVICARKSCAGYCLEIKRMEIMMKSTAWIEDKFIYLASKFFENNGIAELSD